MNPSDFTPGLPDDGLSVRGLLPGQKVAGRYTLKQILGRGGMGVVWMAHDERLGRKIALKVLPEALRYDAAALDDLKRETLRSQDLANDHIVRVYDFVEDEFCAGISMELIEGKTLSALRIEQPAKVFEPGDEDFLRWFRQLGEALQYAHRKVVHRDLKPSNLMSDNEGNLKVTDFGISCGLSDSMSRITRGKSAQGGTWNYMSPQQALGGPPSPLDDVYSMGATIYELLTSRPPFYSGDIAHQVQHVVPPSMNDRRRELGIKGKRIPQRWEETIAACLAKDSIQRPQSVRELMGRLLENSVQKKSGKDKADEEVEESEANTVAHSPAVSPGFPPGPVPSTPISPPRPRPPEIKLNTGAPVEKPTFPPSKNAPPVRSAAPPENITSHLPTPVTETSAPLPGIFTGPSHAQPARSEQSGAAPSTRPAPEASTKDKLPAAKPADKPLTDRYAANPPSTESLPSTKAAELDPIFNTNFAPQNEAPKPAVPKITPPPPTQRPAMAETHHTPIPQRPPVPKAPRPSPEPQTPVKPKTVSLPTTPPPPPPAPTLPITSAPLPNAITDFRPAPPAPAPAPAEPAPSVPAPVRKVEAVPEPPVWEPEPPEVKETKSKPVRTAPQGPSLWERIESRFSWKLLVTVAGVLALLLVLVGAAIMVISRPSADVTVTLQPSGAEANARVKLVPKDPPGIVGRMLGPKLESSGPFKFAGLDAGSYQVLIESDEFVVGPSQITVADNANTNIPINMVRGAGTLSVSSKLPNTQYLVDGVLLTNVSGGQIPIVTGKHTLTATNAALPGQAPTWEVSVKNNQKYEHPFQFAFGRVVIDADPQVEVQVGNRLERTPFTLPVVPPGLVNYVVTLGAARTTVSGNVTPDGELRLTVPGTVQLSPTKGVDYWVDDKKVEDPTLPQSWTPGPHKVLAKNNNAAFPPKEMIVRVQSLENKPVTIDFRTVSVTITSTPAKASVLKDGKEIGITPFSYANAIPGETLALVVKLEGYEEAPAQHRVSLDGPNEIPVKLTRSEGSLKIAATPPSALIWITSKENVKWSQLPNGQHPLPVGSYMLLVTNAGYKTVQSDIAISRQKIYETNITLEPRMGAVQFAAILPAHYTLQPLQPSIPMQLPLSGWVSNNLLRLPINRYQIVFDLDWFDKVTNTLQVLEDTTLNCPVNLTREHGKLTIKVVTGKEEPKVTCSIQGPLPPAPTPTWGTNYTHFPLKGGEDARDLPSGRYNIIVTDDAQNYDPQSTNITLNANGAISSVFGLKRSAGILNLTTKPPGASYVLFGPEGKADMAARPGIATDAPISLPTGDYRIAAFTKGWTNDTQRITISNGVTSKASVSLPYGWVKIEPKFKGAPVPFQLFINNREVTQSAVETNEFALRPFNLEFRAPGFKHTQAPVRISAQETVSVAPELIPWKGPQPGDRIWTNSLGMRFVSIPGLENVWFSVWECRRKDFDSFDKATSSRVPDSWMMSKDQRAFIELHPVVNVTWDNASRYCSWLTEREERSGDINASSYKYRLPTEQEWSVAAGTNYFPWGATIPVPLHAGNYASTVSFDWYESTSPSGAFAPNANGLFDMGGNAWEWCGNNAATGVLRGGSFRTAELSFLSVQYVKKAAAGAQDDDFGFRCVLVFQPPK